MDDLKAPFWCKQVHCELTVEACLFRQRLVWLHTPDGRRPRDRAVKEQYARANGGNCEDAYPYCVTCPQGSLHADQHPGWVIPKERIAAMYQRAREVQQRKKQAAAIWWDKATK